jgi:hypothetical protein
MRHLPLTIALLLAGAPVWAQGTGSSIEKSFSSMQDNADKVQAEVSPPSYEAMQEKAEKFVKDLAGKEMAIGDSAPAKAEPEAKADDKPAPASSAQAPAQSGSQPAGMSGNGMSGNKVGVVSPPKAASDVGSGPISEIVEKNTLDTTPPGGKIEAEQMGDTVLPRNRKSKSAGLRTGDSKKARQDQSETSQTVAAKPVRKIPGFVELN